MKFIPTQGQALLVRDYVSHYSDMRIRGDNKKTTRNNENNIKAASEAQYIIQIETNL